MIPLWSSHIPPGSLDAARRVFESGWLNTGSEERAFREEFRALVGARHAIPTTNGTMALKMALVAAGVRPGDEVVTTPFTFIATNTAILEVGGVPVFADIDYETLNLNSGSVLEHMTMRTSAIIGVHFGGIPFSSHSPSYWGSPAVPVIEDAAHALGSQNAEHKIGERGSFVTFSLQAVKVVTSGGDGGVVCTDNEEYAERLQRLSWYGVDRTVAPNEPDRMPEDITELGFKANMNDLTAALAREAIKALPAALERRRMIGERYRKELAGLSKVTLMRYDPWVQPNYQIFPVHVVDRPTFFKHMTKRGIKTGLNNRRNDRYSIFGGLRDLPNTKRADEDVILIPLHCDLSDSNVDQIIEAVRDYDRT